MKIMWSLLALALMAASTLVVSASTEDDTVWGEQERPLVPLTEEVFAANQAETPVGNGSLDDEAAEDID